MPIAADRINGTYPAVPSHPCQTSDSHKLQFSPAPNIRPPGQSQLAALDRPPPSYSLHKHFNLSPLCRHPSSINTGANPPFQPFTLPNPLTHHIPCHRVCCPPSGTSYPVRLCLCPSRHRSLTDCARIPPKQVFSTKSSHHQNLRPIRIIGHSRSRISHRQGQGQVETPKIVRRSL